jgi:hypothetical protein
MPTDIASRPVRHVHRVVERRQCALSPARLSYRLQVGLARLEAYRTEIAEAASAALLMRRAAFGHDILRTDRKSDPIWHTEEAANIAACAELQRQMAHNLLWEGYEAGIDLATLTGYATSIDKANTEVQDYYTRFLSVWKDGDLDTTP